MRHPTPARTRALQGGFTLLEVMIVIVIIGILAAVAYPSFMDSIRKGRRSEAFAALTAVQQAQERWRANHASYTDKLTDLGITKAQTPTGYYTIAIASPATAAGYTVTAEAVSGTSQDKDTACRTIGVQMEKGNVLYAGPDSAFASKSTCWAR